MNWVVKLREDFGIKSRYELSKITGVTPSTYQTIENDNIPYQKIKVNTMCKIADNLSLSLDDLRDKLDDYEK